MNIEDYIVDAIFGEKEEHKCYYMLMWDTLKENGFVSVEEDGFEIDSIFKAVALQNLLGEFVYRIYDEVNEAGLEDVIEYARTLDYSDEDILEYVEADGEIEIDEDDFELTVKNALDKISERAAEKMLEEFSAIEVFDIMFCSSYAFEQNFTFDFEDYEELQAFIDTNQDQLDVYREEYNSVVNWIETGMAC